MIMISDLDQENKDLILSVLIHMIGDSKYDKITVDMYKPHFTVNGTYAGKEIVIEYYYAGSDLGDILELRCYDDKDLRIYADKLDPYEMDYVARYIRQIKDRDIHQNIFRRVSDPVDALNSKIADMTKYPNKVPIS